MSQDLNVGVQVLGGPLRAGEERQAYTAVSQVQIGPGMLNGVSTVDFHTTTKCSQACPYCWGPRRIRKPVETETALLHNGSPKAKQSSHRRSLFS